MIPLENKRVSLHPRRPGISRATAPFSSLLLLRESHSRDAPLRLHLMLRREGGREGKEGGGQKKRRSFFHLWQKLFTYGWDQSERSKGWIGWSQRFIQQQPGGEVCWCTAGCSQAAGQGERRESASASVNGSQWDLQRAVEELVLLLSTIDSKGFPFWAMQASTSAPPLFYKSTEV